MGAAVSRGGGSCQGHADFPQCQVSLVLSREIGDPMPCLEDLVGGCQGVTGSVRTHVLLGVVPNDCPTIVIHHPRPGMCTSRGLGCPGPAPPATQGLNSGPPGPCPSPAGWEGRLLQTQLVTLFSVLPQRFGKPPLSRSLHGPNARYLQNLGSQEG